MTKHVQTGERLFGDRCAYIHVEDIRVHQFTFICTHADMHGLTNIYIRGHFKNWTHTPQHEAWAEALAQCACRETSETTTQQNTREGLSSLPKEAKAKAKAKAEAR